jgi:hypothetical protein
MLGAAVGLVALVSKDHARPIDLSAKNSIVGDKPWWLLKVWELLHEMVDVFWKLSA